MLERLLGAQPKRFLDIVRVLAERYVKVRYRGSTLGILWSVFNPVIMTVVYALVFGRVFRSYYGGSLVAYSAAVFVGLAVMTYFTSTTSQALQTVVSNGLLLNKMRIPSAAFPVASVLSNTVQLVVGTLPLLILVALVVGRDPLLAPLVVIPLFALVCIALGVGMAVSAAYVFYRDVPYLYELLTFFLFVTSPVFYPLAILNARIRPFIQWNPLSLIIEQLRAIVVAHSTPSPVILLAILAMGATVLVLGWLAFRRARATFMDYL